MRIIIYFSKRMFKIVMIALLKSKQNHKSQNISQKPHQNYWRRIKIPRIKLEK